MAVVAVCCACASSIKWYWPNSAANRRNTAPAAFRSDGTQCSNADRVPTRQQGKKANRRRGGRDRVHPRKSIATSTPSNVSISIPIHLIFRTTSSLLLRTTSASRKYTDIMLTERELQISPIVQESVMHNTKVRAVRVAFPSHHQHLHLHPSSHLTSALHAYTDMPVVPCGSSMWPLHFPNTHCPVDLPSPPTPRLKHLSRMLSLLTHPPCLTHPPTDSPLVYVCSN